MRGLSDPEVAFIREGIFQPCTGAPTRASADTIAVATQLLADQRICLVTCEVCGRAHAELTPTGREAWNLVFVIRK